MEILPIRTKADYRRTLKEIETLMDAAPKSQKGERLDVLVTLVEGYERKHFPLAAESLIRPPEDSRAA
jgi:HTH-type transcriptional regulator / antitoxin HigA